MSCHAHAGGALIVTLAVSLPASILASPQGTAAPLHAAPAASATWTPDRTPWGDPDLQGTFTNEHEAFTPMERPKRFAGRRREDIGAAELVEARRELEQRNLTRRGPADPPWDDRLALEKGSQAWFVVDPPDGAVPPLTPQARRKSAAAAAARLWGTRGTSDSYLDRNLFERCITRGLPGSMLPILYGNAYQIVQSPGYVAIRYEMVHETRVIPIDAGPHVGRAIRLDMGDARGRWEGHTLVVDTTNFTERSAFRFADAATLRLTERFTPTAPDTLTWAVTVEDSATWTRPWTLAMPLMRVNDMPVLEYACHEGNYALGYILSSARNNERGLGALRRWASRGDQRARFVVRRLRAHPALAAMLGLTFLGLAARGFWTFKRPQ